jgi:hypothetical protein
VWLAERELTERAELGLPPAVVMAELVGTRHAVAAAVSDIVSGADLDVTTFGPLPVAVSVSASASVAAPVAAPVAASASSAADAPHVRMVLRVPHAQAGHAGPGTGGHQGDSQRPQGPRAAARSDGLDGGGVPMKLTEAVGALRERRFAWYFAARTTTSIGSAMTSVALAFAVLHISDDPGALAQVLAAHMAAMVIFLLLGGVVADRYSRTVIMQTSHALTFLTQGMAAYLVLTGTAQIWHLVALEAVNGAVSAFGMPAMMGVVPLVVGPRSHPAGQRPAVLQSKFHHHRRSGARRSPRGRRRARLGAAGRLGVVPRRHPHAAAGGPARPRPQRHGVSLGHRRVARGMGGVHLPHLGMAHRRRLRSAQRCAHGGDRRARPGHRESLAGGRAGLGPRVIGRGRRGPSS